MNIDIEALLDAIRQIESGGNPRAISKAGAAGAYQLMPSTASMFGLQGKDLFDEEKSRQAAKAYVSDLLSRFGSLEHAVAAYNAGPTRLTNLGGDYSGIAETAAYVPKVLNEYQNRVVQKNWEPDDTEQTAPTGWELDEESAKTALKDSATNLVHNAQQMASSTTGKIGNAVDVAKAYAKQLTNADARVKTDAEIALDAMLPQLAAETKKMSPWDRAMISAGRNTDQLLKGVADVGNFFDSLLGSERADQIRLARDQYESGVNKLYEPFESNKGIAGTIGGMLPYLLTSAFGTKPAQTLADEAINLLEKPIEVPVNAGKSLIQKFANISPNTPVVGPLANRVKMEWADPIARNAARKAGQNVVHNPLHLNKAKDVLSSTLLGAGEGSLAYDRDATSGAIGGLMGGLSGAMLRPFLTNAHAANTDAENALLEWAKDKHVILTPGAQLGSVKFSNRDASLRGSSLFGDIMKAYDNNNEQAMNRVAMDAIGMEKTPLRELTPEALDNHLKSLGSEYDTLEASTKVLIDKPVRKALVDHISNLQKIGTPDYKQATKSAVFYTNKILSIAKQGRGPDGKILPKALDGTQFKDIRSALKSELDKAFLSGDKPKISALKPIQKQLEDGIEAGTAKFGTPGTLAQWKDLNERNAMTHLVLEHGMDVDGKFNPIKLGRNLMSNDALRTLTRRGGPRLNELQNSAAFANLYKSRTKGGFLEDASSGEGMFMPQRMGMISKLLQTAGEAVLGVLPTAATKAYVNGYPAATGWLNMSGKDFGSPTLYTRAWQQGNDTYVKEQAKSLLDMLLENWTQQ